MVEAPRAGVIVAQTERLWIRQWVPDDFVRVRPMMRDLRVMRYISDGEPLSDQRLREFLDRHMGLAETLGQGLWPLVLKENCELIGFCGLAPLDDAVEIGWRLAHAHWGRGLATEAAAEVMRHGFETLRLPRVVAIAHPDNRRSLRVMEKLGMQYERTYRRRDLCDVALYAKGDSAGEISKA